MAGQGTNERGSLSENSEEWFSSLHLRASSTAHEGSSKM